MADDEQAQSNLENSDQVGSSETPNETEASENVDPAIDEPKVSIDNENTDEPSDNPTVATEEVEEKNENEETVPEESNEVSVVVDEVQEEPSANDPPTNDNEVGENESTEKETTESLPENTIKEEDEEMLAETGEAAEQLELSQQAEHMAAITEDEEAIAVDMKENILDTEEGNRIPSGIGLEDEQSYNEEDYEEYEEEVPQFDREMLLERYQQALTDREQYQQQNHKLQHKLADYFRKKKADDVRPEIDKNVTDQEQRYLKYMAQLDELRRQEMEQRQSYRMQIEELKERCAEKQEDVSEESNKFTQFKQQSAISATNSRSGKPIPQKDIEQYLLNETKKETEVVNVRLENIKLKNKLKKKEMQLKSKEELAEGLHLIDFEQLKIENQTYNEKIEERNEELLKLRKKIHSTVQVLTHLKEKLQFVQGENHVQKQNLKEVEEQAAKKRDVLSRTKQARDRLRIDNQKLKQNCGLLGNHPLLKDFEERKDETDELQIRLKNLQLKHAELTLNCTGVRKKLDQVAAIQS